MFPYLKCAEARMARMHTDTCIDILELELLCSETRGCPRGKVPLSSIILTFSVKLDLSLRMLGNLKGGAVVVVVEGIFLDCLFGLLVTVSVVMDDVVNVVLGVVGYSPGI